MTFLLGCLVGIGLTLAIGLGVFVWCGWVRISSVTVDSRVVVEPHTTEVL